MRREDGYRRHAMCVCRSNCSGNKPRLTSNYVSTSNRRITYSIYNALFSGGLSNATLVFYYDPLPLLAEMTEMRIKPHSLNKTAIESEAMLNA